jgi:asparagine synthase (glutamine-hydrolysing)
MRSDWRFANGTSESLDRMLGQVKREIDEFLYGALLSPTARTVQHTRLSLLSAQKLFSLERECRYVDGARIAGDFIEFGVALGGSAIVMAKRLGSARRFHGLDVFGMIPPPTSEKDDEKSRRRYEVIKSGQAKGADGTPYYGYRENLLAEVKGNLEAHGVPVDGDRVTLHQGLFEETWPTIAAGIHQIAVAHVDCDWYDPVKYCLDAIAEKVAPGVSVILDDYNFFGGCRTATDEFIRARCEFRVVRDSGHLVVRKKRAPDRLGHDRR